MRSPRLMLSDISMNWSLSAKLEPHRYSSGVPLILWLAVDVCLCFFFLPLSLCVSFSRTSSHLCSEPPAAEEIISDNQIRTICIYPLRERSYRCTAHSDSWGQGQMGALIGPVKAPNTPLWSELTAIGWLFISNRIAVDPLAEGWVIFFPLQVTHVYRIRDGKVLRKKKGSKL